MIPRGKIVKFIDGCICADRTCKTPRGQCHCGCGQLSPIAQHTDKNVKAYRGQPLRFIRGHCRRIRLPIEDAKPFKINGVYCRLIPLTRGFCAIVNASDYGWLMRWKWFAYKSTYRGREGRILTSWYARRSYPDPENPDGPWKTSGMHSFILKKKMGKTPDHKNGIGIDNRRKNLRHANPQEQVANRRRPMSCKTKFRGVRKAGNLFQARITVGNKEIFIGSRKLEEEAAKLYDKAAMHYFGKFAALNFPST